MQTIILTQGPGIICGCFSLIERTRTIYAANGMALFRVHISVRHEAIAMSRITPKSEQKGNDGQSNNRMPEMSKVIQHAYVDVKEIIGRTSFTLNSSCEHVNSRNNIAATKMMIRMYLGSLAVGTGKRINLPDLQTTRESRARARRFLAPWMICRVRLSRSDRLFKLFSPG